MNHNYRDYYNSGFKAAAAKAGCDPLVLVKFAEDYVNACHMQKRAKFGSIARLIARMSPKVDPNKLNWFTRLFTTTHTPVSKLRVSGGDSAAIGAATRNLSSGGTYTDSLKDLARSVTRVSPLKILAGLTAAGTAGGLAANALIPKKPKTLMEKWMSLDPALRKKILLGLGLTGGALAAGGIGYAMGKGGND